MRLSILTGLAVLTITGMAFAQDNKIKFPTDYRSTFTNYLNIDRTQEDDQVIHMFANDIAMKGMKKAGKYRNGSILIGEVYKAKRDKKGEVIESELGNRIRGRFALIAVMEKQAGWGADFKEEHKNGDWDFAAFKPDGSIAKAKNLNECRACHAPLTDSDHVFSFEHFGR
ncbi:MAG: hypothetical protein GKS01_00325 [Alphaproteobacteria bacterium]|nr:hypothetical protein [Alphaproteobacteria bacterium]